MFRRLQPAPPLPSVVTRFGIRSREQVLRDVREVVSHLQKWQRYTFDLRSAGLLRPDLSFPAYAGLLPVDGVSRIFNFFDRTSGGRDFRSVVSRARQRDWRGGYLSYDEHDGTDFVCPPGTPLVAPAPGVVVATRDRWLRGGLTLCVDHGHGVITQYTHLTKTVVSVGQQVQRGELIALSGHSGFEMTNFFPWVPPHLHFMVWIGGRPVDSYLSSGEAARPGTWLHGNDPLSVPGPLSGDEPPPRIGDVQIDHHAVEAVMALCRNERIRHEMESVRDDVTRVALLEDSIHHDRPAWAPQAQELRLRPPGDAGRVSLTLPLSHDVYRRACASDTPWSRPAGGR